MLSRSINGFSHLGHLCWVSTAAGRADPSIDDIRVSGNSRISAAAILEVVTSRPGKEVTEASVTRDVQAIYGLGWFTEVRPRIFRDPHGVTALEFAVQENPVVERVEFRGVELGDTGEMMKRMQSQPGGILNFNQVTSDRMVWV